MIRIMLQKLLHKKWMVISLLIGNILLIAVAVSHPMYKDASLQRMLTDEFINYFETNNRNPAMFSITGRARRQGAINDYRRVSELADNICSELGLVEKMKVRQDSLVTSNVESLFIRDVAAKERKYSITTLQGMEDHVKVVTGRMYSDELDEDGVIEAVVTMSGFVEMDLLPEETFQYIYYTDANGDNLKVKVVGVVTNSQDQDDFWVQGPDTFNSNFLISSKLFDELFINGTQYYEHNTQWYVYFDYESLTPDKVPLLAERTTELMAENNSIFGKFAEPKYIKLLDNYMAKEKKIAVTLSILQVPVLVLLCAFLFMISRQMTEMEQSEISLLKSRGAGNGQIFRLYVMQSTFLALVSAVVGIPFGAFLCKALGSANAFLEFVQRRPLTVHYTKEVLYYALAAILVSVVMTVWPAMKQSGISIVKQKQSKARTVKPLWQKLYLDVILFAVSLYGYYNFARQQEAVQEAVLTGDALDPMLFLTSSLFMLGASLLALRIIPLVVKLIYAIGKKRWHPAGYASFLQIIRTGGKQYFIMTFLMLTVALGIFNTTVARTILSNAERNLEYTTGADLVIREVWPSNELNVRMDPTIPLVYTEPDFGKYGQIPGVNAMAKVFVSKPSVTKLRIGAGKSKDNVSELPITLYGIETKDFGKSTNLPDGLLPEHYYTYLNALSQMTNGALVSSSLRDMYGYKVGDRVTFENTESGGKSDTRVTVEICGFVDYFPGFIPQAATTYSDGSVAMVNQTIVIVPLGLIQKEWGVTPYEIWFDIDDTAPFYEFVEQNKIKLNKCIDVEAELVKIKNDTIFQGTNGILTMSFIVILILCSAGYLIYWILSIRSRELLFGIFRAMGMSKGEILRMLINEQIFSSLLSILCGAGIGVAASRLFVPMIQLAYAAADQAIPMTLLTEQADMIRLFGIIGIVLIVCLVILARQVFKMKIAQALKLGED